MAEKKDTQEKQPTIQDIQAFNRTSLTDTARDIMEFAEDNGTSMDKVLASMGMEIDENKQRIEIDDTEPNEKELEEFIRMQSKPKANNLAYLKSWSQGDVSKSKIFAALSDASKSLEFMKEFNTEEAKKVA